MPATDAVKLTSNLLKRLAATVSWLWRGIDPAGLGVQIVLTLGALALAGWGISQHGLPRFLAPAAFIVGNGIGAIIHARWAVADRVLPADVKRTLVVRSEALTLALSVLIVEGGRALPIALGPELVRLAASARLAFGIAAAFVAGEAVLAAPVWFADRQLTSGTEPRVQIPRRAPRLRLRSRSGPPDA